MIHAVNFSSTPRRLKHANEKTVALYHEIVGKITEKAEKVFAILIIFQWLMGVTFALFISPKTWMREFGQTHAHIYAAIFLGAIIAALPLILIHTCPGRPITRHCIAVAQMLFSALLIHLTGGRIETHFHVFGSLAFLAFFRDWRVLMTGSAVVILDHLLRGYFWPESVYGVLSATPWRSVEHAAWVLFEDIVLLYSIGLSVNETAQVAEKESMLSDVIATIEETVDRRTQELKELQKSLVTHAHESGMSQVATGVLHNVGNVLNSANVAAETIAFKLDRSSLQGLGKANSLLTSVKDRFGEFYSTDPKGPKLLTYYLEVGEALNHEHGELKQEIQELLGKLQLIKDVISTQQTYAKGQNEFKEEAALEDVVDTALSMEKSSLLRHEVDVVKVYEKVPMLLVQKSKLVHILLNLIKNAKESMTAKDGGPRVLRLEINTDGDGRSYIDITDSGGGIEPKNISKIFTHGFTTKSTGHGFGLHFCANAANEMGAKIVVSSDGIGKGATFRITFGVVNYARRAG